MTKLYLYLVIGLASLLLGVGLTAKSLHATNAVLASQNASLTEAVNRAAVRLKKDRAALLARENKIASQGRKLAQAQEALSEALQRNKTWSDTDVPTDVQEAIVGRSDDPNSGPASLLNRGTD
jgi:hypothetical protein